MSTPLPRSPLPPLAADAASSAAAGDAPVVALVNEILKAATARDASDIHIEPAEQGWRVRLRIDGALHPFAAPPAHLRDGVVTRLKVLSRLDIAERRVPQDGRLRIALAPGLTGDYRVSSLPTLHGEKLVLRRLDTLPANLSLSSLGFDARQAGALEAAVAAPHGLVLVTGPTGSGKTVTLYCCLQGLNLASRNLCTIEDPAELQLDGLNQVNVRDKAGLSFAVALRAFLRQDPDVIMVGEIRDAETADVALKAAQTGHLVLSTLHTNDAPGAIARLLDIGVAPYHIAAALRIVTAQRLVRRLCVACRRPSRESIPTLLAAGLDPTRLEDGWRPFVAAGCEACHGIGYRGRIGVHQVMAVSDTLRERIVARAGSLALTRQAQADGMRSLREAALARVHDGSTSLDEACAVAEAG
ncbi:GspE/PulE family protein [Burkholderia gladioli]|uniref:GspE/PulE family protein n=1 Tax=Burkholderia gladioli TaxID=28095 RepID=UPI002650925A|nr:ATPase, T2SS/T4P/T4SS family [Burkholderia gladioli]MDN7750400.1 ATPase, T2SS/T4P/T4SS family [Burkholderia gladioli]